MQVGIDSVEINRIKALIESKERFIERAFSLEEQKEFSKRNNKPQHIAAAFSAKEAFSKALGTGISGFNLNEVSLLHKENGKPYLEFSGKALKAFDKWVYSLALILNSPVLVFITSPWTPIISPKSQDLYNSYSLSPTSLILI